jgi:hypothetical protein
MDKLTMNKYAFFKAVKREYEGKLAEKPSDRLSDVCMSICRNQVLASFEDFCNQKKEGFPCEGEGLPHGFWARCRQWFESFLTEALSESERTRVNNAVCLCVEMQKTDDQRQMLWVDRLVDIRRLQRVDLERRKALLTARLLSKQADIELRKALFTERLRLQDELREDRREVEATLALARAVAEKERRK